MKNIKGGFSSIDEYIGTSRRCAKNPEGIAFVIRPGSAAQEKISYQMPTFFLKGNLVHFAAFKSISVFIRTQRHSGIQKDWLFTRRKGSINSRSTALPLKLIARIVKSGRREFEDCREEAAQGEVILRERIVSDMSTTVPVIPFLIARRTHDR